jgi:hypothetical protein
MRWMQRASQCGWGFWSRRDQRRFLLERRFHARHVGLLADRLSHNDGSYLPTTCRPATSFGAQCRLADCPQNLPLCFSQTRKLRFLRFALASTNRQLVPAYAKRPALPFLSRSAAYQEQAETLAYVNKASRLVPVSNNPNKALRTNQSSKY